MSDFSIKINNGTKVITAERGEKLLKALADANIFLPTACGGRGLCGLCKTKVLKGGSELTAAEKKKLKPADLNNNLRLACQLAINSDLEIELPQEVFTKKQFTAKCTEIKSLTDKIKFFRFELLEPKKIDYTPGSYIQLQTPAYSPDKPKIDRAYSIASDPNQKNIIELIIKVNLGGISTTYLFEHLKIGDEVKLNGPYGEFRLTNNQRPVVFIAGGSGISAIRCLLYHLANTTSNRKIIFYYGVNYPDELILLDEMKKFENILTDFRFVPVVSEAACDTDCQTGLVTQAVERDLKQAGDFEAYLCGSPAMLDAAIKTLKKLGLNESRIFYDKFN